MEELEIISKDKNKETILNLSIEEFRKLSNTNTRSRYTLVDKPVTLSNPEFCENHL